MPLICIRMSIKYTVFIYRQIALFGRNLNIISRFYVCNQQPLLLFLNTLVCIAPTLSLPGNNYNDDDVDDDDVVNALYAWWDLNVWPMADCIKCICLNPHNLNSFTHKHTHKHILMSFEFTGDANKECFVRAKQRNENGTFVIFAQMKHNLR